MTTTLSNSRFPPFRVPGSSMVDHDYDHWMARRPAVLKSRNLQDQVWYHGKIKRITAQTLLKKDGDFLLRDSISNPGDFVLTGLCRGQPMHFEVHKAPSSDPTIPLFYFEDEQFRSIVDLVDFYFNHGRQVTKKSQFVLLNPIPAERCENGRLGCQFEIEATYAPFVNKQTQLAARFDRSLSQAVILNQAKKRLGSEHDLQQAATREQLSKSFFNLNGPKTTSFGVEEDRIVSVPIPPQSARPVPSFPPPKLPMTFAHDLHDYDDLDYEAMEEEHRKIEKELKIQKSPPPIPAKPANLKQKRHSDFIEAVQGLEELVADPKPVTRKHSAHSLFNPIDGAEIDEDNNFLPSYLDRTQSCSNLVLRQRSKSGKDEEENGLQKYPSVKIDPAPLLPARSNTTLNSISALTAALNEERDDRPTLDYDDLKKISPRHDPDYDTTKDNEKPSCSSMETETAEVPRPRMFVQLRSSTLAPKSMRNLFNFLASLSVARLSLLITSEDCKVFQLTESNVPGNFRKLFQVESKLLREEILDRNACLFLIVQTTLKKAQMPKDFLKMWILTAAHLLQKIGNGFAFGAIMAALNSEATKHPRILTELDQPVVIVYRNLSSIYEDFINGKMPGSVAGCFLPFIQPLLQLFSKSDYVQTGQTKAANNSGLENLEVLSNLIHLVRHVLFENVQKTREGVESAICERNNPLSTESLIHCLLDTPGISELKESERRKIRQLFDVSQ